MRGQKGKELVVLGLVSIRSFWSVIPIRLPAVFILQDALLDNGSPLEPTRVASSGTRAIILAWFIIFIAFDSTRSSQFNKQTRRGSNGFASSESKTVEGNTNNKLIIWNTCAMPCRDSLCYARVISASLQERCVWAGLCIPATTNIISLIPNKQLKLDLYM